MANRRKKTTLLYELAKRASKRRPKFDEVSSLYIREINRVSGKLKKALAE